MNVLLKALAFLIKLDNVSIIQSLLCNNSLLYLNNCFQSSLATTSTSIPTTSVPTTSTESIPMTPSPVVQPCLDDPRVTCDTSLCDGAFKQFCPATCNTCSKY